MTMFTNCHSIYEHVTFHLFMHAVVGKVYVWNFHICFNTLRPSQNGRHFPDDIFKYIFLNENVWFSRQMSLKFVPKVPINRIPALVQIMAWHRPGDKPLCEPMMVWLPTHICVTWPQWVNICIGYMYLFIISSRIIPVFRIFWNHLELNRNVFETKKSAAELFDSGWPSFSNLVSRVFLVYKILQRHYSGNYLPVFKRYHMLTVYNSILY